MQNGIRTFNGTDLHTLIAGALSTMVSKGYSASTIASAKRVWGAMEQYAETYKGEVFNEAFRQSFIREALPADLENRDSMYRTTRAMNILSDYAEFNVIFRQYSTPSDPFSEAFAQLFEEFMESYKGHGLAKSTLSIYRARLLRFHDYLVDSGIASFNEIQPDTINSYVQSMARFSTTYVSETLRLLRQLFAYAYHNGYIENNYEANLPHVRNLRQQKLPSTFTEEEMTEIVASVDRNNPIGKRNYAIFLLAARLGLRGSDIVDLQFSDIDWDKGVLSKAQVKTKKRIDLPLTDDVAWAIIDYLKNGRPNSNCSKIFICHRDPYDGLSSVSKLVTVQMRKAGMNKTANKKQGMHAFRHGLATTMLEKGIALPIIQQTLGHADIGTTEIYLRVSMSQLSKCGLEVDI